MIKYMLFFLPFLVQANELSFYTLGLSYHGIPIHSDWSNKIHYKIDSRGNLTYHPEVSVILKDKFIYGFSYLKNTFYNDAYMFSFGKSWEVAKYTELGILGSLYIYEREPYVPEPHIFRTETQGFVFFPWFYVRQNIPINPRTYMSFICVTNGLLTHLALGTAVKL